MTVYFTSGSEKTLSLIQKREREREREKERKRERERRSVVKEKRRTLSRTRLTCVKERDKLRELVSSLAIQPNLGFC